MKIIFQNGHASPRWQKLTFISKIIIVCSINNIQYIRILKLKVHAPMSGKLLLTKDVYKKRLKDAAYTGNTE